ncbi:hypothetical protein [Reinekea sp.]|jgi:hypothetical protein|uniref:hypothetical protein n=1 Tax=Reinekea sp. TaxID=1970455 RepID=UPI003989FB2A
MQVSKKEARILSNAIENWRESEVISEPESQKLKSSYEVTLFDWKRTAKYSFWLAISCLMISISSALMDKWLIELFKSLFHAPVSMKFISFTGISAVFYFFGVKRKLLHPEKIYSNEAIFFLGIMTTAASIAFLGQMISTGTGHYSILLLLGAVVYGLLGLWFPSKLVWLFSLLSLGSWFGAETGYASGWGAYYLGMNFPLRFVLFGLVLIFCGSYIFNQWQSRNDFLKPTRAIGLLYLFIALWIMSIFGNYGDTDAWIRAKQIELFHWSVLFALASAGAIYHGVKYDDGMTRGFGLTFIFINLYTRFFEYFWDDTHKAIFFAVLALSFWYLGSRAEKIWQLSLIKDSIRRSDQKE